MTKGPDTQAATAAPAVTLRRPFTVAHGTHRLHGSIWSPTAAAMPRLLSLHGGGAATDHRHGRHCDSAFFIPYGYTFYLLHNFVAWYKMTKLYIFFL